MITVYLSGKITGLDKEEYTRNFMRAEDFYKSCGYNVVNPVTISEKVLASNPAATYEDFMAADLEALKSCTHIVMLEDWETSKGARREKAEAEKMGLEIMYFKSLCRE